MRAVFTPVMPVVLTPNQISAIADRLGMLSVTGQWVAGTWVVRVRDAEHEASAQGMTLRHATSEALLLLARKSMDLNDFLTMLAYYVETARHEDRRLAVTPEELRTFAPEAMTEEHVGGFEHERSCATCNGSSENG